MDVNLPSTEKETGDLHLKEEVSFWVDKKALANARMALAMFDWQNFDSDVAGITGEMLAYQISAGKPISFQDTAIVATAIQKKSRPSDN